MTIISGVFVFILGQLALKLIIEPIQEFRMTKSTIKLLNVVALTVDLPEYNLYRGQVGTVVELLADGATFEVEFSDACGGLRLRNGRTYESVGLRPAQIMVLHFEPASPDSVPEMVPA